MRPSKIAENFSKNCKIKSYGLIAKFPLDKKGCLKEYKGSAIGVLQEQQTFSVHLKEAATVRECNGHGGR